MSLNRTLTVTLAASALALAACSSSGVASDGGDGQAAGNDSAYGLATEGVLVVGTEGTYRPFSYHEGGSGPLVGYDIEVVEAVADKLDLQVEYQETQWDAIFAGLDAGRDTGRVLGVAGAGDGTALLSRRRADRGRDVPE